MKTYIIAEIGVNHNGSLEKAKELIALAKFAGADAVKFQTFQADKLVLPDTELAPYQMIQTHEKSQKSMLEKLELSRDDHFSLAEVAKKYEIEFISTPFDIESLQFLVKDLKLSKIKISSGDITNYPLLYSLGQHNVFTLISTGGSNLAEISKAIRFINIGRTFGLGDHDPQTFMKFNPDDRNWKDQLVVMHCVSDYPAQEHDSNLLSISSIQNTFQCISGYSDHTQGFISAQIAVSLGARYIEKHLTLDNEMKGPDHKASLNPENFKKFVEQIRFAEVMLGDGVKVAKLSEESNIPLIRRGLYAARHIQIGDLICENDILIVRPETKVSTEIYWNYINKPSPKNFRRGEEIS